MRTLQHDFEAGNCSLIDAVKDIMRYRISLKELNSLTGKSQGKTMSQAMSLDTQMPINGIDAMFREGQDHCREVGVFKNDLQETSLKLIIIKVFP